MNRVFIIGNLTKDPEVRHTSTGKPVVSFQVAVQRRMSKEEKADFIPVVAWNKLADLCGKYMKKGSKVGVAGSIQTREYDDKEGIHRYITEILAEEVEFLSPKKAEDSKYGFTDIDDKDLPSPKKSEDGEYGFTDIDDKDLPFN